MTRSPLLDLTLTDAEHYTSRLRRAVHEIRRAWPDMLPTQAPAQRITASRSRASGVAGDHSAPKISEVTGRPCWPADNRADNGDIDPLTRVVDLRTQITLSLNGWCRAVMEERPITNSRALPLGDDVRGMCSFLDRHADWAGQQDWADAACDELEPYARAATATVDPPKRERHVIGPCPFVTTGDDPEIHNQFCRGIVTMRIGGDDDEATCSSCDRTGPPRWWMVDVMRQNLDPLTPEQCVKMLSARLHVTITGRTLRNWIRAGRVTPLPIYGPEPKTPRYWLDPHSVLDEVARMDRECPTCGRQWSGAGVVCARCYQATLHATPTRRAAGGDALRQRRR